MSNLIEAMIWLGAASIIVMIVLNSERNKERLIAECVKNTPSAIQDINKFYGFRPTAKPSFNAVTAFNYYTLHECQVNHKH